MSETNAPVTIKITPNTAHTSVGKLADAIVCFNDGPLAGLSLIGFAIWERRNKDGRNVTFPARQYSVNGERRSFALLRPITDTHAQDEIRDLILSAYARFEAEASARARGTEIIDAKAGGILGSVPGVATERADPFF